jgi:two-component system, OmpR family, phosphate regulon response regulator PhoB
MTEETFAADPRIVLVEDDATIASMYSYQFEQDGHTVWTAADGEAGLQLTREVMPDIVFLDVRLPKLDGFEVLARLREDPKTAALPVIILSNYGSDEMRKRGLELGAQDYLVKARVTPIELASRIWSWVRS